MTAQWVLAKAVSQAVMQWVLPVRPALLVAALVAAWDLAPQAEAEAVRVSAVTPVRVPVLQELLVEM